MAVAQDATGVPREWLVQLGSGWYAFIGTSGVAFALATTYACSQFLHRTLELSRAAKRSRSVAARSGGCTTEYRRLMMGLSTVALALRTLWHLDPASFEGILPRAVSFLLLRVPQCVLFLQALFVVAFTRRFTISMLKLSRIKSKITVGRYKYVFAVVAVLLVVAVACGFVGSLGTLATPLHLAEQGIFASVAVATMVTDGLSEVTSIIGVSSCKGGVGKSTVALNLAYSLAEMGGRVGLFDADVYGPSLPSLVQPEDTAVVRLADKGWLRPLSHHGVRLMSYGWVAPRGDDGERGGAAMRGPMASSVVQQLSQLTDWGALDVLVVDMPPGTGDVVITLGQKLAFSGAVIVTTPHPLARVDVRKGVELFQRMRVPSLALVNNMAYLRPSAAAPAVHPFGQAADELAALQSRFDIPAAASVPLDAALGAAPSEWPYRSPEVLDEVGGQSSRPFANLADSLARELMRREHSAAIKARRAETAREADGTDAAGRGVAFVGGAGGIEAGIAPGGDAIVVRAFRDDGAEQHAVAAVAARRASLAADAGAPEDVHDGVTALACAPEGNYAVAVRFSDGHEAILPLEELLRLGRGS
ncbi:hypothetical protein FNF28_03042 [Cafeteria roenbergensis]|uniref:Gamma-butyrobetaine hydroxylase-like N-terminal domain-containing protein n=1 Tax=Cafeteria roenbergensis TaxID=33653 RepID=A0A5A8DN55_CAFRO|nr:hypothetical protein FNF28_03042 [Cafeteria roenbergensis]